MIHSIETGEEREVPVKPVQFRLPVIWLPDGKSVFVTTLGTPKPDLITNYRVDVQTGGHVFVRSFPMSIPGGGDISPDGKTHFFFAAGEPKLRGGVISCDIETGRQQEIFRIPDLAQTGFPWLAVSPDSKHLALQSPVDGNQWTALRLAPATGGELRELCRFPQSEIDDKHKPTWTPDGRNVLIVRLTGKAELWRIPIAGGEPQRTGLSMEGMRLVAPHPDGRRIAFDTQYWAPGEVWVLENILGGAESKAVAGAK